MARHIGPKQRLQRRIGEDLGLKTNALKTAKRINQTPGQHGAKSRRKTSNYGVQLKEKQKAKYIYGVMEKQLRKLYEKASANPVATGTALLSLLERRLDNVVYRLGWAPTRPAARQLVSHGQMTVNGKKMDIPSYEVRVNDIITITSHGLKIPMVNVLLESEPRDLPEWLDRKKAVAKVKRYPEREEIKERIEEQLIVEYYSR